jgi:hypothetical protein
MKHITVFITLVSIAMLTISGCDGSSNPTQPRDETYNPTINPADFTAAITNPYLPFTPGTTFIYEGTTEDGKEHIEVAVTHDAKQILGVTCIVVRDRVWIGSALTEDTLDWYAQDQAGNVWYFGEDSKEIENGTIVSTEGSWEAGIDGAKPGIVIQANPQIGTSYRQEYYYGKAEDMAQVLSLSESASVPYGTYTNCLQTKEWTPLEPDVVEHKYYAAGIGLLAEETVQGGTGRVELVNITTE